MKNVEIKFFPEDATKKAIAEASIPEVLISSGVIELMAQNIADVCGKDFFVCAEVSGYGQMAHAYGREQC